MDTNQWRLALLIAIGGVLLATAAWRRSRRGGSPAEVLGPLVWLPVLTVLIVLLLMPDQANPPTGTGRTKVTGVDGFFDLQQPRGWAVAGGVALTGLLGWWRRSLTRQEGGQRAARHGLSGGGS